jgi:hypothetical protein
MGLRLQIGKIAISRTLCLHDSALQIASPAPLLGKAAGRGRPVKRVPIL